MLKTLARVQPHTWPLLGKSLRGLLGRILMLLVAALAFWRLKSDIRHTDRCLVTMVLSVNMAMLVPSPAAVWKQMSTVG